MTTKHQHGKIYIGARITEEVYDKLCYLSKKENRSISNFMVNLIINEWERVKSLEEHD